MKYSELPVIEQVPGYHMRSPQSKAIIEATTDAALRAREGTLDVLDQMYVHRATWGLDLWEAWLGIETDPAASPETRRAAIIAKLLGTGPCTPARVAALVKAVCGYDCSVLEYFPEYAFSVRLSGSTPGIVEMPVEALIRAVGIIKPAHLEFRLSGITWDELESMGYTWDELEAIGYAWDQLKNMAMVYEETANDHS